MYGWRGRIGLVVPSANPTMEPEFHRYLPRGISVSTARMPLQRTSVETLVEMADGFERSGEMLSAANVDVAVYGCTTGSLVEGPGFDVEIETRLEEAAGVPAVSTAGAVRNALRALGVETLVVATPYTVSVDRKVTEFLEADGYDVLDIDGLGLEDHTIGELTPEDAYRQAIAVDRPEADAVFISCTGYRTFEAIETAEADLEKPVISSNSATLWNTLETLDIEYREPGLGQLFDSGRSNAA